MSCKTTTRSFWNIFLVLTNAVSSAYIHNADLTPLDFSVCAEAQTKGKKKDLQDAYAIAAGQHDIDYYKNLLKEHERAREEELEEQAAIQAEKETKSAKKGKRKSSVVAEPDEDTAMESVNETPANGKNGTKRRKKVNETDVEDEKVGFMLPAYLEIIKLTRYPDSQNRQTHAEVEAVEAQNCSGY